MRKEREKRKRERERRKEKEKRKKRKRERERKKKKRKVGELLPQISGFLTVRTPLRSKVFLQDEGYTWVQKLKSFIEDPTKEIQEIPSIALQEVGIVPNFVYFPP